MVAILKRPPFIDDDTIEVYQGPLTLDVAFLKGMGVPVKDINKLWRAYKRLLKRTVASYAQDDPSAWICGSTSAAHARETMEEQRVVIEELQADLARKQKAYDALKGAFS